MNPKVESFKVDGIWHVGILFRTNRVRQWFACGVWIASAALLLGGGLRDAYPGSQAKMILVGAVMVIAAGVWIRNSLRGVNGIAVTENGVIWSQALEGTHVVPWDEIDEVGVIDTPSTKIGMTVHDPQVVAGSTYGLNLIYGTHRRSAWHFKFDRSALVDSVNRVADVIEYFRHNPEARGTLGNRNTEFDITVLSRGEASGTARC
jgi:hypothetical protein